MANYSSFSIKEIIDGTLKQWVVDDYLDKEEALILIRNKILMRKEKYPSLSNKALARAYNEIMLLP